LEDCLYQLELVQPDTGYSAELVVLGFAVLSVGIAHDPDKVFLACMDFEAG